MMKRFLTFILICIECAFAEISFKSELQPIYIHELFTFRISPDLFNFTITGSSLEQFRYRPSLLGRPSLPSWMNFQFSKERGLGYLYGSASENYANRTIDIEIVGLNKQNYETRRIVIPLEIISKAPPMNKIEMKITNLNWVHLTDLGRVQNLKGIFQDELWPESVHDLSIIFMESAVKMGSRLPLKPQNREGVVVKMGSNAKISKRLQELNEEIKPLAKLSTCTFKKTKVQQIFQNAGFAIDWCAFKIISSSETETTNAPSNGEGESSMLSGDIWHGMNRDDIPERNYSEEIAIAVAIPTVLFAMFIAMLTTVICFRHEKFEQPKSNEPLQMVQYSGTDSKSPKTTTTLRSLHEPYTDNLSLESQSPTSSFLLPEGSPKMNPYYRPNPPAYSKGRPDGPSSSSTVRFMDDI